MTSHENQTRRKKNLTKWKKIDQKVYLDFLDCDIEDDLNEIMNTPLPKIEEEYILTSFGRFKIKTDYLLKSRKLNEKMAG